MSYSARLEGRQSEQVHVYSNIPHTLNLVAYPQGSTLQEHLQTPSQFDEWIGLVYTYSATIVSQKILVPAFQ